MTTLRLSVPRLAMPHLAVLCLAILFLPGGLAAQGTGSITGTVTSETGQPLAGASVMVTGGAGTLTRADGTYRLDGVRAGRHQVRASTIGYGSQIRTVDVAAGQAARADFQLQTEAVAVEGLVVTGYGTANKQQLPSAVEVVDARQLDDVTTENVATMLQGKVAGVTVTRGSGEPGSAPRVRIRGVGSILAGGDPLYVVDGVIADASMAQSIAVDNIASVSVLKDAAATSLYGSRAANGVLVITTKAGQAGGTRLQVTSAVGVADPIFGEFELMNSRELYDLYQSMGLNNVSQEVLQRDTDWRDIAYGQGRTADVNVSASGGDERTRFFVSGGYYTEDGTLLSTGFDRLTGRVNLEHAVNDRFNITARAYGGYENRLFNPSNAQYDAYLNLPWDAPRAADGSLVTGLESEWLGRERRNFLYDLEYNWSEGRYQDFGGDLALEYDLASWLSVSSNNRVGFEYDHRESYNDARTQAGSAIGGGLGDRSDYSNSILTSNLFRVDRDFGDHSLDGLAGFEYQRNFYQFTDGLGVGIFPGLGVLNVTAGPRTLRGNKAENSFASVLSQVNYGYLNRYFLTGSYRRDGSSRFGADNRWGDFYSIAGAWLISDEAFLQDLGALDQLKLRASYGTTGNAEIGDYLAQSLYAYSAQYDGQPGSIPLRTANPNLTWEIARTLNVGVDMGLFDRVDVAVDVYRRVNDNLLQNVEQPKTTGFQSRTLNVGSVLNQGIELSLSTENLRGAFTWSSDFNFAANRNEVLSLHDDKPVLRGQQRILEGRDMFTWFQRRWVGVDPQTGDPLWEKINYDANGNEIGREPTSNYSQATLQPVGTASPNFTGGMRNTFGYGGLSLSAFFTFVSGVDIYHDARRLFDADGAYYTYNNMRLREGWTRWEKPGDVATHPKPVAGGNKISNRESSRYLEDGSYARLRNVTLSYDLPASLLRGLRASSARVYVSGDNLVTFTDFSGMDPEVDIDGTAGTKYPISKKMLFGVQVGM